MGEGGTNGVEIVSGGRKLLIAIGEAVAGGGGVRKPEQTVDGARGTDGNHVEGRVVVILEYEPDFRSTLFGEVDGHGVGGESGDVDAGEGAFTDSAPCELSVREDGNLDEGRAPEISGGGFELEAGDGGRAGQIGRAHV